VFDPDPVDHGLSHERTDLAWTRSGLAFVVCVAVLLRRIWPLHGPDQFVALACVSGAAAAWAVSLIIGRTLGNRATTRPGHMSTRRAGAITAGTMALAAAALVLGMAAPS
jgi:hypothetical protein